MTTTSDHLGRAWPHAKLDRLLADPAVARAVRAAEHVGHGPDGRYDVHRVTAWAQQHGRSREGIALLVLLCWRSACNRGGRHVR